MRKIFNNVINIAAVLGLYLVFYYALNFLLSGILVIGQANPETISWVVNKKLLIIQLPSLLMSVASIYLMKGE